MSDAYPEGLDVHAVGETTVVHFKGKRILDEQTVQFIDKQLNQLVDQRDCKKLLLNFQDVEYLSSAARGMLINLQKKMISRSGRLSLCNVIPQILEVFSITKLDKTFRIDSYPDDDVPGEDDPDENMGAVPAILKPPKPSGGGKISLPPPPAKDD